LICQGYFSSIVCHLSPSLLLGQDTPANLSHAWKSIMVVLKDKKLFNAIIHVALLLGGQNLKLNVRHGFQTHTSIRLYLHNYLGSAKSEKHKLRPFKVSYSPHKKITGHHPENAIEYNSLWNCASIPKRMIWRMWWWIWFTGKGGMITRESLSLFKACKGSRNFSQGINFPKSKGNYYTKGVG